MNDPASPVTRCLIALGSNLGDRLDNVRAGVAGLEAAGIEVFAVSPLYETAPVGGPENQGPYLNAALVADTTLDAADVLALLHRLEAARERQRVVHWGPRTLDLDLLVYGDLVSDAVTLEVPHPRMHERRFVMVPVCDIAPDLVHPRLGRTMRDLLADLPVEPGDLTRLTDTWHTDTWHTDTWHGATP
jgi:2-amino-4-hydroxy-6-hydroxymethyldihydropteridine diphosphokinase